MIHRWSLPNADHRPLILVGVLGLVLTITAAWTFGRLSDRRSAAIGAATDLADCRRLATQIQQLGRQPALAGSGEMQLNELTRRIERSAKSAQIQPDSLIRISPDPASRVGNTAYKKKSTQVLFRGVTLRQIMTFLHTVAAQDTGPQTTRVRLVAPHSDDAGDRWTVETTLTYLIYEPKTKATHRR